jgi:hypothetical protein
VLLYWDEFIKRVQPIGDGIKVADSKLFSKRKVVWDAVKQLHSHSSTGSSLDQAAAALEDLRLQAGFNMQDFIEVLRACAPTYKPGSGSSTTTRAVRDRLLKQSAKAAADTALASGRCPLQAGIPAASEALCQQQQQQQPLEHPAGTAARAQGALAAAVEGAQRKRGVVQQKGGKKGKKAKHGA